MSYTKVISIRPGESESGALIYLPDLVMIWSISPCIMALEPPVASSPCNWH